MFEAKLTEYILIFTCLSILRLTDRYNISPLHCSYLLIRKSNKCIKISNITHTNSLKCIYIDFVCLLMCLINFDHTNSQKQAYNVYIYVTLHAY